MRQKKGCERGALVRGEFGRVDDYAKDDDFGDYVVLGFVRAEGDLLLRKWVAVPLQVGNYGTLRGAAVGLNGHFFCHILHFLRALRTIYKSFSCGKWGF